MPMTTISNDLIRLRALPQGIAVAPEKGGIVVGPMTVYHGWPDTTKIQLVGQG